MPVTFLSSDARVASPTRIGFVRFLAVLTLVIALGGAYQLRRVTLADYGVAPLSGNWFAIWLTVGMSIVLATGWLLAAVFAQTAAKIAEFRRPNITSKVLRAGLWVVAALSFTPLIASILDPSSGPILESRIWLRMDFLWWQSMILAACLIGLSRQFGGPGAVATAVIAQAAFYRTLVYLPDISSYPLSIAYSEASQLFESSQFFGRLVYGQAIAFPVLNPALHLLLGLPFLLPHSPLWLHRLWAVVLRTGLIAMSSWLLARRMRIDHKLTAAVFAGWAYLFLFQGPIYLHLTVPVIILLAVFDPQRNRRSWGAVLLASAWAGISRINWFPVPSLLAASLYLLEVPVSSEGSTLIRYLRRPIAWILAGTATAFVTWRIYVAVSGNEAGMFASSLSSDLLWYRLLPNAVDAGGLLRAVLIVSIAPALIIWLGLRRRVREWHVFRLAGLAAGLLVLLTGGLVVSVKIGGGGDIHNLDAYLLLLLIVASAFFWGRFAPEKTQSGVSKAVSATPWPALALTIAVPTILALAPGGPLRIRDAASAEAAIAELQQQVEEVQQEGGQVLFIDERHLITFGEVPGVHLIEPYDREILMEMAMARNRPYIEEFQQALRDQRFEMIVAHSASAGYKDRQQPWAEENNIWVTSVASLLACEYQSEALAPGVGVVILSPREGAVCP